MSKIIITAAITGAIHVPSLSPYLPITPEQIIDNAVGAAAAGAAIVHIHARDPKTGEPSSNLELMREIVSEIKKKSDAVICITTGASQMMTIDERLAPVPELQPELASCNAGTMNFVLSGMIKKLNENSQEWEKQYLLGTNSSMFANTYSNMEQYIKTMAKYRTRMEFEVYDVGMINNIAHFVNEGIVDKPIYIQFVMGVQGGIPASVENLVILKNTADRQLKDFVWSVAVAGRKQLPLTATALALGGNVRVGLEDNIYIRPHELAKNCAEQVVAIRTIAEIMGKEIASPDDAREMLLLKGGNLVKF
ncbi:MAG: 3-keto-5-aminohexanoate cleavage protein [Sedimentibacter sp.]|uniref:3-keto-5-aminohexanoate cleavage protein n=1 Tax=Sedimentibacter sp. TaxID=1960295 RepID=UPI003158EA69